MPSPAAAKPLFVPRCFPRLSLLMGLCVSTAAGAHGNVSPGSNEYRSGMAKAVSGSMALAHVYESTKADDGMMELDEAYFWHSSRTFDGRMPDSALCDADSCEEYSLLIASGAARLRVGLATAERTDTFAIELYDPEGLLVASDTTGNQFNSEAMVDAPASGEWRVLIRPENVSTASYRLRAKLESETPESRLVTTEVNRRPLYPNLRTVPPYEFTFTAPLNPLNGLYPPDTVNPPASVLGYSLYSCTIDEALPPEAGGAGAKHCLRLTSGPINVGEGIYDMRFTLIDDFVAGTAELNPEEALSRLVVGDMQQAVHFTDGTTELVQAGTYSFHPTHMHFHDDYILSYYIYVGDPVTGRLERVGVGTKSGFCPADQLWGNWREFEQGTEKPGGDSATGSCSSPTDGVVGLSVGWGDVYRWQRPGQYVEFDGLGNGRYVIQAQVDEYNNVIETDETDNVSYAYIEVQGETIITIERGWGESPWDPRKTVFTGPHPTQREADGMVAAPASAETTTLASRNIESASGGGSLGWLSLAMLAFMAARRRHV